MARELCLILSFNRLFDDLRSLRASEDYLKEKDVGEQYLSLLSSLADHAKFVSVFLNPVLSIFR